jgi:hypothetical protein
MRAKNIALTAYLLTPLIVLVILVLLIVQAINKKNLAVQRPPGAPAAPDTSAAPPEPVSPG